VLPERVTSHPILLRWFTPADAPRVQALLTEAEVAEPTASIPHPYPAGAAAAWIASHDADRERGAQYTYAIASADGATLIGAIGLRPLADLHDNIGYWAGRTGAAAMPPPQPWRSPRWRSVIWTARRSRFRTSSAIRRRGAFWKNVASLR
jgi:RimJ/RimL family protein N-acetyltransferase